MTRESLILLVGKGTRASQCKFGLDGAAPSEQKGAPMLKLRSCALSALVLLAGGGAQATPVFFGPTSYLSTADIPTGFYAGGSPTALENFEDGSLDFALVASAGSVIPPSSGTDSVDADDGLIDGSGTGGHSFFLLSGSTGITITLPFTVTAAAMVWTDGSGTTTFEAFGPGMASLGTVNAVIGDGQSNGTTADDHFFGVQDLGGIVAIKLSNTTGGIEIDHVQFGAAIPEPSTAALLGLGLVGLAAGRRRIAVQ